MEIFSSLWPHLLTWEDGNPVFWSMDDVGLLVLDCGFPYLRPGWVKPGGTWEGDDPPWIGLVGGGGPGGPGSRTLWYQDQWLGGGCLWGCWESLSTWESGMKAKLFTLFVSMVQSAFSIEKGFINWSEWFLFYTSGSENCEGSPTCSWSWASVLCRCWAAETDRLPEGASSLGPAWWLGMGGRLGPLSTTREPKEK